MKRLVNGKVWCPACKQYLGKESFHVNLATSSGLYAYCKTCRTKRDANYQASYYKIHRETLLPKHIKSARESYERKKNER